MARTTEMRLIELMTLSQDISSVIEYLGKNGNFQIKCKNSTETKSTSSETDIDSELYDQMQNVRTFLNIPDLPEQNLTCSSPSESDRDEAYKILNSINDLKERYKAQTEEYHKVSEAYKEARAFSNLQVSFSELDSLSFLSLQIGKIEPSKVNELRDAIGEHAVIISLGDDGSRILAASSKKSRFALSTELKKFGFVSMEIPKDFKGIPDDALEGLKNQSEESEKRLKALEEEKENFAVTHKDTLLNLIKVFCVGMQIQNIKRNLESTSMVYRISGWIPKDLSGDFMKGLDELTEGRIAIREYKPEEILSVVQGKEQVPVKLKHGKFVSAFERMIFSYGSPVYGTIDPTPFVALFFTLLFGMMFGDLGQGLVFLLAGILMAFNVIKVAGWNKFAPIFIAIGVTSSVMGLITGEFFTNETVLRPFALWVTGLFGNPHAPILKLMPQSDPSSVKIMFLVFGIAVAVGFLINTVGLIINIVNKFMLKKWGEALFGKSGLSGALFFWYVVVFAVRIAFFSHVPAVYDWIVIGITLFFASFSHPFERLLKGEKPVENGLGSLLITGIVELIEVISNYLSNTVSFLRVGAFAIAHAVLGFIINFMTEIAVAPLGVLVLIIGNVIVIVLEGMIVAIQVVRLQYYEFFGKFFNETGSEFSPLVFHYGNK